MLLAACAAPANGAERAACANLGRLACAAMPLDEDACVEAMLDLRPESECSAEWDAWVACVEALETCPTGDGALCPTEYTTLGTCAGPAL
jgi:hypothetical protein